MIFDETESLFDKHTVYFDKARNLRGMYYSSIKKSMRLFAGATFNRITRLILEDIINVKKQTNWLTIPSVLKVLDPLVNDEPSVLSVYNKTPEACIQEIKRKVWETTDRPSIVFLTDFTKKVAEEILNHHNP